MAELAQECITRLHGMGYSIRDIERELDGRVTWRTLYRWHKQENATQARRGCVGP